MTGCGRPACPNVGGCWDIGGETPDLTGWQKYWGTASPLMLDFYPAEPAQGIAFEKRIEEGFEIIEYESGARTRQVLDNDITYSMPDFQVYPVRDRASWKFYRDHESRPSLERRSSGRAPAGLWIHGCALSSFQSAPRGAGSAR